MERNIPKWLKQLQENSWELEILISGGAIFTLFQLSDIWLNWFTQIQTISFLPGRAILMLLGTLSIEMLKIGFILHLILRSYWLAMVCINYVYPSGINKENIKWKKPFKVEIQENEDLHKSIIQIDQLCGIVMFLSIMSTFLMGGLIFTFFVIVSLPMILGLSLGFLGSLLLVSFISYLIDLISGGLLRKTPYLSYVVFVFFRFYDFISFRKHFEKSIFLFSTNIPKFKFYVSSVLFIFIVCVLTYLNVYKQLHWPNVFDQRASKWSMSPLENEFELFSRYYRSELENSDKSVVSIQSKIINESYLDVQINYLAYYDHVLNNQENKDDFKNLADIFSLRINDSVLSDIEWLKLTHENSLQLSLNAIVEINNLTEGRHILYIEPSEKIDKANQNDFNYKIPFWVYRDKGE